MIYYADPACARLAARVAALEEHNEQIARGLAAAVSTLVARDEQRIADLCALARVDAELASARRRIGQLIAALQAAGLMPRE